ncbi:tetratricopeptide repeat protein [Marinobacter arenosus]|uniref:tetratricopeptide repeat protein n=1 Tax=Marinobacter arenosus TaxID=2856822 RepID=UPI001C4D9639|nr:MSHA biogenesis protein MshN [Marinobacter arenosus]MBW0149333.1 MSHA biogenesis protein MshN [Marinobacter arenosus]
MSLLNDALRAAEQRQNRPGVAAAYTGQSTAIRTQRRWLMPVTVMLVAALTAAAVYGFLFRDEDRAPVVVKSAPTPAMNVSEAQPTTREPEPAAQVGGPVPEPVGDEASASVGIDNTTVQAEQLPATEDVPEVTEAAPAEAPANTGAGATDQPEQTAQRAVAAPEVTESVTRTASKNPVKQFRETPEAVDLRVSRELSRLLRAGESRMAEQRLTDLTSRQTAPVSREVFARNMLIQDMPERALPWASDAEAQEFPALRLLEARALLALGKLESALAALLREVPSVREHTEYRVTLATLLQQSGEAVEAARHWSALISVDDSRPAWWVGLAIALESSGELNGAVKAYAQAAQLPGLSPSLADYVRNRLKSLQAG